ncbi:hypothetical protein cgc1_2663 [Corynebacterium glutamicum]|nr:hypothetical protein cgc1_2663 [Corynebacterium glutamicum]
MPGFFAWENNEQNTKLAAK